MFLVISCDFTMRKGGKMVVELRKMVVQTVENGDLTCKMVDLTNKNCGIMGRIHGDWNELCFFATKTKG